MVQDFHELPNWKSNIGKQLKNFVKLTEPFYKMFNLLFTSQ